MWVDIDVSALPISKHAEGSEKGYVAKRKNQYTRQLTRVLISQTQEIVSESLYPGKIRSNVVFKEMLEKLETALDLDTRENAVALIFGLMLGLARMLTSTLRSGMGMEC